MEQKEKELLEIIEKYNHGEYPMITEVDFCACLFSFMRLKGVYTFDISKLELFIQKKLDLEEFRFIFADIDSSIVIQEGISFFEIINSVTRDLNRFSYDKARIHFSREQAMEFISQTSEVYCEYIEEFAEEFQNLSLTSNHPVKSLKEKSLSY